MTNELKSIKTRKDYEKYKISQDIQKYFCDLVVDLKSKVDPNTSFADLLALCFILFTLYAFTKGICSKISEKKKGN